MRWRSTSSTRSVRTGSTGRTRTSSGRGLGAMKHAMLIVAALTLLIPLDARAGQSPPSADTPVFVAYYWRARPGKTEEYNDYIKHTAEAIDEDARRAGVF